MNYPLAIEKLIKSFSKLPSVGPKTAERYVFYLLKQSPEQLTNLAHEINSLKEKIVSCSRCNVLTEKNPCPICSDQNRDKKIICLVENTQDMWAIENTHQFKGKYFVLTGLIKPLEGIHPDSLNIKNFLDLIKLEKTEEVIIALNFTMEGEGTSLYIQKQLTNLEKPIKISRLAKGLPLGSDLEYADNLTLTNAFKYRQNLK
jgi:recombination protein RecR